MARSIYSDPAEITSFVHSTDFVRGGAWKISGSGFVEGKGIVSREGNLVFADIACNSVKGDVLEIVLPYNSYRYSGIFYGNVIGNSYPSPSYATILGGSNILKITNILGVPTPSTATGAIAITIIYICGLFNKRK